MILVCLPLRTAQPAPPFGVGDTQRGAQVFAQFCAACHSSGVGHAPAESSLRLMSPGGIYHVLTVGPMRSYTQGVSVSDKKAVAEYLSKSSVKTTQHLDPPACAGKAAQFDFDEPPAFSGWGLEATNERSIPARVGGIDRANVGRLTLKWAFGVSGGTRMRSLPAIAFGAIFVGTDSGIVYALDRQTGCARWSFAAAAELRTAIVVSPGSGAGTDARPTLYFGDVVGKVYALDAANGELLWSDQAGDHPTAQLTGTPVLDGDRLYVPVSSVEEGAAADPKYPCCTFRGSVIAYDAHTGRRQWQTYMVDPATVRSTNAHGSTQIGPSGVAIWNAPAIDAKRGLLYVATGDNYSNPPTATSDAIVAMDRRTGQIRWALQPYADGAWNVSCATPGAASCPLHPGRDFDFGAAVILAKLPGGGDVLLAGSKSGWVFAIDPDRHTLLWKQKVGEGGIVGGVHFGMAASGDRLFVPINDAYGEPQSVGHGRPGMYALEMGTGHILWEARNDAEGCRGKGPSCSPGISAPATHTADLVLSGARDGWLRIYDQETGKVLWRYDTTQSVTTIGGGPAAGGSMSGGVSPLAYGGMLIAASGYDFAGNMPGNVLLVFSISTGQ